MAKDQFATSDKNITYYLGAGASAEALPLVNNIKVDDKVIYGIPASFRELAKKLILQSDVLEENYNIRDSIVDQLKFFAEKAELFGTIDTYAKYLFLKDKSVLKKLKDTLIFFFLYKQCLKKFYDKRALIFLTTILQYETIFPSNVKILSWNYDYQIEMAALNFVTPDFVRNSGTYKRKRPLVEHFPANGIMVNPEFDLIHLNGCAGYYQLENFSEHVYDNKITDINSLFNFLKKTNMEEFLNFAWEGNDISNKAIAEAEMIAARTDILVVIGYTFPVFNREIDKGIFAKLNANSNLKIYFQDPNKDGKFLKSQFGLNIDAEKIISIKSVGNYYIPLEL